MSNQDTSSEQSVSSVMVEGLIRFGLIAVILFLCIQVFSPFARIVGLGLILAIALYPLNQALANRIGCRPGLAATLLVIGGLLLLGLPTVMLGGSMADQANQLYSNIESGTLKVSAPAPAVADWPLVGEPLYQAWSKMAEDLQGFVEANHAKIREFSRWAVATAASIAGAILAFLGSLIVAGIIMAFGESGSAAMGRIFNRLSDSSQGPRLQTLSTATIRSVAMGVVGVSFIQALLLGIGFILAGIPAPGILALIALFLGILQVPAMVIALPAIAYIWLVGGDDGSLINIALTVYFLISMLADNVLKPIMLGRGVEAPMPVILIGAMGGMISFGIIGLFSGPVILATAYVVFMEWVDEGSVADVPSQDPAAAAIVNDAQSPQPDQQ
ncbi:MAG: AI-2E family transporter [Gammaproteobacteria bacterium]|nr:AI-2E family transporter [Gammaproteobacteria bacterium]MBT5601472.1 AI-2E family transporter [Gammaproteobacteria bacterium]